MYGAAVRCRSWAYGKGILAVTRLPVPVFCVGNVTVGGTGKTPGVIWLVDYLQKQGRKPGVITRGYGRINEKEPFVVSDGEKIAENGTESGDEPRLMAKRLPGVPVLAGADRASVGRMAVEKFGVDCLVMDDGFQHLGLFRDLDVVCVDAPHFLSLFLKGNEGLLLPAGFFREPLAGLKRAGVVFLTKANLVSKQELGLVKQEIQKYVKEDVPVVSVRYELSFPSADLKNKRVLALSGLGNPESFERGLQRLGADVLGVRYKDHHVFSEKERQKILQKAEKEQRTVVVTEKDFQRLPADFPCVVAKLEWIPEEIRDIKEKLEI